ncbi:Uncharacterised protein [uncultured archaeon]|nr:Uncharacterised protein [uncultured archaeon]
MKLVYKIIIGIIVFFAVILTSFFYYAGARLYNAFQGNPPGTFNNTLALEIPLALIQNYNRTLNHTIPYECDSRNPYYSNSNYSLIPCINSLKINETLKNICLEKQKLIENVIIQRRGYSKIQLGWTSMIDQKVFEINDCLDLISNYSR